MRYPGGKGGSGVVQRIVNMMPPHRVYVEPFLGGGAVLRAKRPAVQSIGIDRDRASLDMVRRAGVPGLELVNGDALEHLRNRRWDPDTLVYADPPYLFAARSCSRPIYRHEMGTAEEHRELLAVLRALPCMVMVSGYPSDLYARELDGWRVESFQAMTRAGRTATECVWLNFPPPLQLHDYRYLGDDYRERERIKRKRDRWRARLLAMPELERYAVLSVVADLAEPGDTSRNGGAAGHDVDARQNWRCEIQARQNRRCELELASPSASVRSGGRG